MDRGFNTLDRGFELAHFIFPERAMAIEILTGAYNKLHAQCHQARKRNYWRDKYLKRWITRISPGDADALQWLICFESDACEKRQEKSGAQTLQDLVLRYVKTLVRSGTCMSSFYVCVGIGRLLHSYTTTETQQAYEVVTERYLGADEYRRAKRVLMNKLETRFSSFVATVRMDHGEIRFEAFENQERWSHFVNDCLKAFTPWSTKDACMIPANFSRVKGLSPGLISNAMKAGDSDAIEINRCHAFIDPECYARLMRGLEFEDAEHKLAVPRFNMENHQQRGQGPQGSGEIKALTRQERQHIEATLVGEAARRRSAAPQTARVLVDGVERMKLDLEDQKVAHFDIVEGVELIEVWAHDQGEQNEAAVKIQDSLLATYRIEYTEHGIAETSRTIALKGKRRLVLVITPDKDVNSSAERRASVSLKYLGQRDAVTTMLFAPWWRSSPLAYTFAALLLVLGWCFGAMHQRAKIAAAHDVIFRLEAQLGAEHAARVAAEMNTDATAVPSFPLISDDSFTRGEGSAKQPVVSFSPGQQLVNLQLPVGDNPHAFYHAAIQPFMGGAEILSESQLQPVQDSTGPIVVLALPAALVSDGQDYAVDLRKVDPTGKLGESNTFTFHVIKQK